MTGSSTRYYGDQYFNDFPKESTYSNLPSHESRYLESRTGSSNVDEEDNKNLLEQRRRALELATAAKNIGSSGGNSSSTRDTSAVNTPGASPISQSQLVSAVYPMVIQDQQQQRSGSGLLSQVGGLAGAAGAAAGIFGPLGVPFGVGLGAIGDRIFNT